ncbi:MAG: DUF971 domain-containing protein [Chloroflexi bacterium]|nr:DUF971 domain-containing protein [Chloroflexota bacterium]
MSMQDLPEPRGATTPVEIELDREAHALRFVWSDGQKAAFDWEFLRWRCPCAFCSGEGGRPGELEGRTELRPEEYVLTDVNVVGRYAIVLTWQDGHDTGIFTFRGMRALAEQAGLIRAD